MSSFSLSGEPLSQASTRTRIFLHLYLTEGNRVQRWTSWLHRALLIPNRVQRRTSWLHRASVTPNRVQRWTSWLHRALLIPNRVQRWTSWLHRASVTPNRVQRWTSWLHRASVIPEFKDLSCTLNKQFFCWHIGNFPKNNAVLEYNNINNQLDATITVY